MPDDKHTSNYCCVTLKFEKALDLDLSHIKKIDQEKSWVTLGYFDLLQIHPIPSKDSEKNWVKYIYNELSVLPQHSNAHIYTHPLHIMTSLSDAKTGNYHSFFENNTSPFLCVSFLQCAPSFQGKPSQMITSVKKLLLKIVSDFTHNNTCKTDYIVYETLNLSDFVILWKTDSLPLLLNVLKPLQCSPLVGDLHSIPAIAFKCIKDFYTGDVLPQNDVIDQIVTRYIIRNSKIATSYFKENFISTYETPCFYTGVEDISTVFTNIKTEDFIKIINWRLFSKGGSKLFSRAFLDCETHLGSFGYYSDCDTDEDTNLYNFCSRLNKCFSRTMREVLMLSDNSIDSDWLRTSESLFHSLLDMSRNSVSDGFCYLVVDSAAMFCSKLYKLQKQVNSDQLKMIHRYLRGWGSLLDQTMRLDGKFTQQPGFTPALCPIPSKLLELYLAFTSQCGKMMQMDSGDNSHFALLIVPKLCRRIKVESVFIGDPPTDRLLFVDIPLDILFDPFFAISHLCHEIAHFCGDDWRLRGARKEAYIRICAKEFANQLDIQNAEVIEDIYRTLSDYDYKPRSYLDSLRDELSDHLNTIIKNSEIIQKWIEQSFPSNIYDEQLYARTITSTASWKTLQNSYYINSGKPINRLFWVIQNDYYELFRECYADIASVFTLKLSPIDYIRLVQKEYALSGRDSTDDNNVKENTYVLVVQRWSIVLNVIFGQETLPACQSPMIPEKLQEFSSSILECYHYFFGDGENIDNKYLDRMCVNDLRTYLERCLQMMRSIEKPPRKLQYQRLSKLRNAFDNIIKHALIDDTTWQIVSDYRSETLATISDLEETLKTSF